MRARSLTHFLIKQLNIVLKAHDYDNIGAERLLLLLHGDPLTLQLRLELHREVVLDVVVVPVVLPHVDVARVLVAARPVWNERRRIICLHTGVNFGGRRFLF